MVTLKEVRMEKVGLYEKRIFHLLYDEVLKNDNMWHFFFEGVFSVIRCRRKSTRKIKKILKKEEIEFSIYDYEEDQEMTAKYLEQFIPIFHNYSVLAMINEETEKEDFSTLFHRIVHCFLNPIGTVDLIKKFMHTNVSSSWESHALTDLAISHAHSRGVMHGVSKIKQAYEAEKIEKTEE